jgi:predicted nucleotidyltransferase
MSTAPNSRPPTLSQLRAQRERILTVAAGTARRTGASNLRVFGSVARQEREANDVDLLVDLEAGRSLLDLAGLHVELEDLLQCPVHVMERVKPRSRAEVEAEALRL